MILHDAMLNAGFSNCRDEWWHYSYGDAGWAVRTGRSICMFGYVEPAEPEYREADETFINDFLANPPF
jgi:D-alanyl-D-alanine dipeptidase